MKQTFVIVAATILAVMASTWIYASSSGADEVVPIVRAGAIELVDEHGQVRAQLNVDKDTGEVIFRLRESDGAIRVKLGASTDGSGLLLLDESTEPGVHILAKHETAITVNVDGVQRQIRP